MHLNHIVLILYINQWTRIGIWLTWQSVQVLQMISSHPIVRSWDTTTIYHLMSCDVSLCTARPTLTLSTKMMLQQLYCPDPWCPLCYEAPNRRKLEWKGGSISSRENFSVPLSERWICIKNSCLVEHIRSKHFMHCTFFPMIWRVRNSATVDKFIEIL